MGIHITKPGSHWISSGMVGDYRHIIICLDTSVEKSGPRVGRRVDRLGESRLEKQNNIKRLRHADAITTDGSGGSCLLHGGRVTVMAA